MLKGFLTARPNGLWMVTYSPPSIARVGKTKDLDAFVAIGDGFGQHRVPYTAVRRVWGEQDAEQFLLTPHRVTVEDTGDYQCWLSRRGKHHGYQCMLTESRPLEHDVDGEPDLWPCVGDPMYCQDFCTWFAEGVWGFVPSPLHCHKLPFSGKILG